MNIDLTHEQVREQGLRFLFFEGQSHVVKPVPGGHEVITFSEEGQVVGRSVVTTEPDRQDVKLLSGKTAYRIWSDLLSCHIWLVADEEAKARLQDQGKVEEPVYTIAEIKELLKLPQEQRAYVHTWKAGLDGAIDDVKPER